jgi:hypothetical protein
MLAYTRRSNKADVGCMLDAFNAIPFIRFDITHRLKIMISSSARRSMIFFNYHHPKARKEKLSESKEEGRASDGGWDDGYTDS